RAAQILYILVVIATLVALRQIVRETTSFEPVAVMGLLLASAIAIQAADQLQRPGQPHRSRTKAIFALAAATVCLFICAAEILIRANPAVVIAALLGMGTLLAVFAIRRWLLGPWGRAGVAAAAAIGMVAAFGALPIKKDAALVTALSM